MKTAFLLLALACTALAAPTEEDALHEFMNGYRQFSADLYREVSNAEHGNFVSSPIAAATIMALTHEGARGESAAEIVTGLSLPSTKEKTRQVFKSFLPKLTFASRDLFLSTANKVYVGKNVEVENDFKQVAVDVYDAGVENVDFAENIATAGNINKWVEERTHSKIRDLINAKSLSGITKIVLVNILHLKGKWTRTFDRFATEKKKFYGAKTTNVDMMHQTDYFRYYENADLNSKFLELTYQGGNNLSMIFILPNEIDGLDFLEKNIKDVLKPQPLKMEKVEVHLPRFYIETEIHMIPILKELGIKKIFNGGEADLSGLSSTDKNLVISQVIQKVYININENGTQSAGATSVSLEGYSAVFDRTKYFIADHPFIYFVQYNGVILFTGRCKQ